MFWERVTSTKNMRLEEINKIRDKLYGEISNLEKPDFESYIITLNTDQVKNLAKRLLFEGLLVLRRLAPVENSKKTAQLLVLATIFSECMHNLPEIIANPDSPFYKLPLLESLNIHYFYIENYENFCIYYPSVQFVGLNTIRDILEIMKVDIK